MNQKRSALVACVVLGSISSLSLYGCGDDEDDDSAQASGGRASSTGGTGGATAGGTPGDAESGGGGGDSAEGPVAGAAGEAGLPVEPAVYAFTTQIFGDTENTSYVLVTDRIDSDTELRLETAVVEIQGRALGTGPEETGMLFVASDSGPTITRYELDAAGELAERGSVSFLGEGITRFGEYGGQFQYVSPEKAYWFDGATAQIVIWNPSTMTVVDTISLAELAIEGETLSFTAAPVKTDSKLYTFVAWRRELAVVPRLAIVAVDLEDDTSEIVEDTRCGYARDGVLDDDGFLYVATEAFGSAAHYLNAENPDPCLLRFDVEAGAFDPDFQVSLAELTGSPSAGSLVVGPGNQPFLRVLDESAVPADVTNPRALASLPVWTWAKLELGDEPVVDPLDGALGGGSVLPFELGERVFAPLFVAGEETLLQELTTDGPSDDVAITIPGLVFSAVKLR
jgi:hypothetical protein